jgi:hypothetical protein
MKSAKTKKVLPPRQRDELLKALKARFEKNMDRHKGLQWAKVQVNLEANPEKLWSLHEMERTDGEPDVVGHDKKTGVNGVKLSVKYVVLHDLTTLASWGRGAEV